MDRARADDNVAGVQPGPVITDPVSHHATGFARLACWPYR